MADALARALERRQVLASALAARTVVALRVVAEANGIPVEGIDVEVNGTRSAQALEAKQPWERRLRIATFVRRIRVQGAGLTEEHRSLLLRGAEHCPVDITLRTPVAIETSLELAERPATR
ncbi:MAG TPA: OsmC family protein [Thermodesulfobacteriota bacterium]|nr:OsmC family protein [Thermodesulfobacteriota bacterium]